MSRSLYKYTVKVLLVPPLEYWGIAAIATTSPRPLLLKTFPKSRLEWRTTNRWTRNRKLFFRDTRTCGRLSLLAFPGTWPTATREPKLLMLSHILHVPHLNNIGNADSCLRRTLTDSWWGNGLGTKPPLPCIFYRLPLGQNLLAARLQIDDNGPSFNINSSPRVKSSAIPDGICGSDSSVEHPDPSLRKETSLGERGMTHKVLHASYCPLHLLVVDRNSIKRHSKHGMHLWRTLDH